MKMIDVSESRMEDMLDVLFQDTTECPPVYDYNGDRYERECPALENDDLDCCECWMLYLQCKER